MWEEKLGHSERLVKLQRPFPLIIILRAGRGIFSRIRRLGLPVEKAPIAANKPDAPPPMIIISYTCTEFKNICIFAVPFGNGL